MSKQNYAYLCPCCGEWINNLVRTTHDARMASYREYQRGTRLKSIESFEKLAVDAEKAGLDAASQTAKECAQHLRNELARAS